MDPSHQQNASLPQDRPEQPPDAGRPVGTGGLLHDQHVEQHPSPGQGAQTQSAETHRHLGPGRNLDASGVAGSSASADGSDSVVALGGGPGPDGKTLAEKVRRRRRRLPDGELNREDVIRLLERQGHRCALSGWPLTPQTAALDHIVAVTRGGLHRLDNVQVLHRDVNRAKYTLTNEEFIALCGAVWQHTKAPREPDRQPQHKD